MGEASPRATLIGMLRRERGLDADAIAALCDGSRYAPPPLTQDEAAALARGALSGGPAYVEGDYPQWLDPHLQRVFGAERAAEGAALSNRAPLDLRVNTLAAERDEALAKLRHLEAVATRWSPLGVRIRLAAEAKSPAIHAEPIFLKGQIEIQDEGSQLAALLADAKPGEQVVDLCAGAGGKTLALAAAMDNRGQIYATDLDKRRLAPIHARLARAGARNVQVRTPTGRGAGSDSVADLAGRADLVMIDAPCTGTGAWRRNPDAKWRMRPGALSERLKEQQAVLEQAAMLVKPGGRIAYITCSILGEENGDQVQQFMSGHPEFSLEKPEQVVKVLGERAYLFARAALLSDEGLLMTPRRTDTDGFFVSLLRRQQS
jgi:16S rRNA (cytosine967-C5)-methyltransferase